MDRNKKIIKASFLGIILNFILVIFKSIVGFIANSISIILDAINNFSDAISQIIIIIGTKISGKKPTKKHPFGFGRVEYVTTQIVAAIIIAVGVMSLKDSIEKIINPSEANYSIY